jgi:rhamnogalacturonyl hydrolase YesR
LITAFLARGVNEGWLDRETYTPIVMRAFAVLMDRVDADGVVHGIQPPGTGPAFCSAGMLSTNQTTINVNYGAGVVLLAAAEMLKLLPSS